MGMIMVCFNGEDLKEISNNNGNVIFLNPADFAASGDSWEKDYVTMLERVSTWCDLVLVPGSVEMLEIVIDSGLGFVTCGVSDSDSVAAGAVTMDIILPPKETLAEVLETPSAAQGLRCSIDHLLGNAA